MRQANPYNRQPTAQLGTSAGAFSFFGYGSLVNYQTRHREFRAWPGELAGWVREWRIAGRSQRGRSCALTIRPESDSTILGVLVEQPAETLGALDQREWRYDRHVLGSDAFLAISPTVPPTADFHVYRAKRDHYRWGDHQHPILQSYVDVVLSGYYETFGEAGVTHFLSTTRGWHVPILNDRPDPRYSRAVEIDADQLDYFDRALAEIGVTFIQAQDS